MRASKPYLMKLTKQAMKNKTVVRNGPLERRWNSSAAKVYTKKLPGIESQNKSLFIKVRVLFEYSMFVFVFFKEEISASVFLYSSIKGSFGIEVSNLTLPPIA